MPSMRSLSAGSSSSATPASNGVVEALEARKPRDFDAGLKSPEDNARDLKVRKVQQLGEPVIATGADALSGDELAGALIVRAETKNAQQGGPRPASGGAV